MRILFIPAIALGALLVSAPAFAGGATPEPTAASPLHWSDMPPSKPVVTASRRAARGQLLPEDWRQPQFVLKNWQALGLYEPHRGFGWSRFHDDAVLTDRDGRIVDIVEDFAAQPLAGGKDTGSAEAVAGRTGQWQGRWEGRWLPEEREKSAPIYEGVFQGRYEEDGRWASVKDRDSAGEATRVFSTNGASTMRVTIVSEPAVTTTKQVDYVTEYVRVPVRKAAPKRAPARKKKPYCECRVVYR